MSFITETCVKYFLHLLLLLDTVHLLIYKPRQLTKLSH